MSSSTTTSPRHRGAKSVRTAPHRARHGVDSPAPSRAAALVRSGLWRREDYRWVRVEPAPSAAAALDAWLDGFLEERAEAVR